MRSVRGRESLVKRRPSRRIVIIAILVALIAAAAAWYFLSRNTSARADTAQSQTVTATASLTTLEQSVSTSGTLTPAVNESVSFAASGTVLTVDVEEGDTVEEGQQLATIDTLELTAARAEALYDLETAKAALEEAEEAADGSDSSDALIESRTAQLAVAQDTYDAADEAMSDATLTAPAAGLVTAVNISVGDAVTGSSGSSGSYSQSGSMTAGGGDTGTSSGAFTIVGTDAWTVDVTVGEADVANIAVGNQVEMTSDSVDETIFGVVTEIGKLPSSSSGSVTYPVSIEVTGEPEGLYDGIAVDVSIIYQRRTDVLTIPAAAVTQNDDGTASVEKVVSTSDDGTVTTETTTVELGETSGSSVEITSGLSEGDQVSYTVAMMTQDGSEDSGTDSDNFPSGEMPDMGDMPDMSGGGGQMPGGGQMGGGQG